MRIGFDAKRAFFNHRGLGNYSRNLIGSLSQYYPDNHYLLYSPQKIEVGLDRFEERNRINTELVYPEGRLEGLLNGAYWRSISMAKRFDRDQLDIYHGLSNELPRNSIKSKCKKLVTIHDLIFLKHPEWYPFLDRKVYANKWKSACEKADMILCISEQTKSDLLNWIKIDESKTLVQYQSCDPIFSGHSDQLFLQHGMFMQQEYEMPYKIPDDYILFIGGDVRKNLMQLVMAVHLLEESERITIVAVGKMNKEYKIEIEAYLQKYHLEKWLHFLGEIPKAHLMPLYRCAKAFVYPSSMEGFGIPIIEALFSRIPVITSKGGCFEEAGGEGCKYIDPNLPEEIAEALNDVLYSGSTRMDMILKGWEHVQQFAEEQIADQIMIKYKSLV